MSNEEHNIHDFDIELICEYFSSIERQGPGSREATLRALSFIDNLNEKSNIVDLGLRYRGASFNSGAKHSGKYYGH
jgi:hypothetical protein